MAARNLLDVWPCFIVGKVGTDLQTTFFAPEVAQQLADLVTPLGSVVKGHYTDWVENPEEYPATGMGAANVGPEFTTAEYLALVELEAREADMLRATAAARRRRASPRRSKTPSSPPVAGRSGSSPTKKAAISSN